MAELKQTVFAALDALGISYASYEHPPVFTSEDAAQHWTPIGGTPVKNLFLRNKKGNREYLLIVRIDKRVDLQGVCRMLGDDRLSFGSPDRLMATLGLTPGSVSPFGLLHPNSGRVQVLIDEDLRGAVRLLFHPNINTATLTIGFPDLETFLASRPNSVRFVKI